MSVVPAPPPARSVAPLIIVSAITALSFAGILAAPMQAEKIAPLAAIAVLAVVAHKTLLRWQSLLAILILVVLLIPIKRYSLPGNLPFDLEPYRLLVGLMALGWLSSLLVDPRVRARATGFEAPVGLLLIALFGSVVANPSRVAAVDSEVVKGLTFFLSYIIILYVVVGVTDSWKSVASLTRVLVGGGAVVAFFALVEARTGFNVFNRLSQIVPLLSLEEAPTPPGRGGRLRVFASSQNSIALGAAFMMLLPLALVLARTGRGRIWVPAAGLLVLGALSTVSRTSVIMLAIVVLVFLVLRPRETRRLWPALIPLLLVVHVALPATIGGLKSSFFPEGGLIAQQSSNPGWRGSGRLADIGPAMEEFSQTPLLGQGYSTRITGRVNTNAQILDNQWLKTLLETGLAGLLAWLWIFARSLRRLGRCAREDDSEYGWLCAGFAASIAAFAGGMFFYDAFSFIQVTLLLFIVLAFSMVMLRERGERAGEREAERARLPRSVA